MLGVAIFVTIGTKCV